MPGRTSWLIRKSNWLLARLFEVIIFYFTPEAGADSQYVTIYGSGFGTYMPGVSQVKFATDKEGSFAFPDQCGTNFWTDTQVVVKVPDSEEVGALDESGPLQVITSEGQVGLSQQDFNYNQSLPITPGICSLYPSSARVGETFNLAGEGFTDSTLYLSDQALAEEPESDNYFEDALIPLGSRSGPVKVVRGEEESNSLNLEVLGSIMPDEPIGQADYYQWQFTTCQDCLVPAVVESVSCNANLASPVPLKSSQENYPNSLISATFNTDMDNSLFELGTTVLVASCGQDSSPANCVNQTVSGSFDFGLTGESYEYFTLDLDNNLNLDTWYRVILTGLASQLEKIEMEEPYQWFFKTRAQAAECPVDRVAVNPAQRLANSLNPENNNPVYLGQEVRYSSSAYNGETCNICPDTYQWSWSSSQPDQANIDETSAVNSSLMSADGLTDSNLSAVITAQATDAPNSPEGSGLVDIVPGNPEIIYGRACVPEPQTPSPWPGFEQACINAKISVQFDMIMDPATTLNLDNIQATYLEGEDQISINGTIEGLNGFRDNQTGLIGLVFTPVDFLPSDRLVRISLSQDITSLVGANLTGARTWSFKTNGDNQACDFSQAAVDPALTFLNAEGATEDYTALAQGETCELITVPDLSWSWSSTNSAVASVLETSGDDNELASVIANNEGFTFVRAQALGIQNQGNNGRLTVSYGPEPTPFGLINYLPVGDGVCLNTKGMLWFNLSLSDDSLNFDNFEVWQNGQRLSHCSDNPGLNCSSDELCQAQNAGSCLVDWSVRGSQGRQVISILNDNWLPNTDYAIRVYGGQSGVTSVSGEQLTSSSCADGMQWNEVGQYCWWQFSTAAEACAVERIGVEPLEARANVGQKVEWLATPYSANNSPLTSPITEWVAQNFYSADNSKVADVVASSNSQEAESTALAVGLADIFAGAPKEADSPDNVWGSSRLEVLESLTGPEVVATRPQPDEDNVCRNSSIQVEFDKLIDAQSVSSRTLWAGYLSDTLAEGCLDLRDDANVMPVLSYDSLVTKSLASRLFNWFSGNLLARLINSVRAANDYFCPLSGSWRLENNASNSELNFSLIESLPALEEIKILVVGGDNGIKATNGLSLTGSNLDNNGNFVFNFKTRADICTLSAVGVAADQSTGQTDWTFATSFDNQGDNDPSNAVTFDTIYDSDKRYLAAGYSLEGTELLPIPGVYEWTWDWRSDDPAVAAISYASDETAVINAQNVKSGQTPIVASAVFPEWYQASSLTGSGLARVDLCENPWPARISEQPGQYLDEDYNFGLSYCRDAGGEGTEDDLPALETSDFIINSYRSSDIDEDELIREYLIPVPTTGDLVGLRVYENANHLSPLEWYRRNAEVKGSPNSLTVDGYQAIQDGRTVYVAAADINPIRSAVLFGYDGQQRWSLGRLAKLLLQGFKKFILEPLLTVKAQDDVLTDPGGSVRFNNPVNGGGYQVSGVDRGYTDIFLLSYNQGANLQTLEIVNQLLHRWQFNTNIDNPEVKAKVVRDVKRLADLRSLTEALADYQAGHDGQYPALTAGTFLRGMSTSKWPSWSQTFAPELGFNPPVDPLNDFGACIDCQEPQLANSGFEGVDLGWNTSPNVTTAINTDSQYLKEGNQSLSIAANQEARGISQELNLIPNVTYEMSAWVYVVSGRVHLTFVGDDYGNEWFTPQDYTGWFQLKNRLVTDSGLGNGPNNAQNLIYIQSHEGGAEFYVDQAMVQTAGGNCGYDPQTCWNPLANSGDGAFACGADSYFYRFQSIADVNNRITDYSLSAKMESTTDWYQNTYYLDSHLDLNADAVRGCDSQVIAGFCGDTIVQAAVEECEPGLSHNICSSQVQWYTPAASGPYGCFPADHNLACQWYSPLFDSNNDCYGLTAAQCCGGYCGDGVLNTQTARYSLVNDEGCEAGVGGYGDGTSQANQYACSANCQDVGGYCGDRIVQSGYGEECDSSASGWDCLGSSVNPTCANTCEIRCPSGQAYLGTCGNNTRESIEICDGSDNNYAHSACTNACSDVSCTGSWQACDGNRLDNDGCEININNDVNNCGQCGNVCQGPQGGNGQAQCNAGNCGIVCDQNYRLQGNTCVPEYDCGNGQIEGDEICDDGENNGEFGYCNNSCDGIVGLGNALFYDNFEDDEFTSNNWEEGFNQDADWYRQEQDDNYKLVSEVDLHAPNFPRDFRVTNNNASNLTDVNILVQVDFSYSDDDDAVIFARHNGQDNYRSQSYYALWNDYGGQISIRRVANGSHVQALVSTEAITQGNYWFQFRVLNEGNNVRLQARWWQVGTAMPENWNFNILDDSNNRLRNAGQVGLAGWIGSIFYFDNFQVYPAEVQDGGQGRPT